MYNSQRMLRICIVNCLHYAPFSLFFCGFNGGDTHIYRLAIFSVEWVSFSILIRCCHPSPADGAWRERLWPCLPAHASSLSVYVCVCVCVRACVRASLPFVLNWSLLFPELLPPFLLNSSPFSLNWRREAQVQNQFSTKERSVQWKKRERSLRTK